MPTSLILRSLTAVLLLQTGLHAKEASSDSSLWLNYRTLAPDQHKEWSASVRQVFCPGTSAILLHAQDELLAAAGKLTDQELALAESPDGEGNPLFPASDPATGSINGSHPKSKFLVFSL